MKRLILASLAAVTGCMPPSVLERNPGRPPGDGGRELPQGMAAPRGDWASRKVNGKEEPNRLIAADRSSCTVSADKFREVSIGESVFCAWSK
jgi:hypothetical protein